MTTPLKSYSRMSKHLILILLLGFSVGLTYADSFTRVIYDWGPLYQNRDGSLQAQISKEINTVTLWKNLVKRKKMAIGIVDLNGASPRFASINGDTMIYAASLPKIAILLAAVYSFEEGTLEESPENLALLKDMIAVSSNSAASRMIDLIGMEKINAILQMPEFLLYDKQNGGGLWVGKPYAKNTNRIGDPLKNISHAANANQVCRLYYMLHTGKVISPQRSEQMLEILKDPLIDHKFVKALHQFAPEALMFRKSGTWKHWHADSVMVRGKVWRNYILVAFVEHKNGEAILQKILPTIENIIRPRST